MATAHLGGGLKRANLDVLLEILATRRRYETEGPEVERLQAAAEEAISTLADAVRPSAIRHAKFWAEHDAR
jgi:hypothetical protein